MLLLILLACITPMGETQMEWTKRPTYVLEVGDYPNRDWMMANYPCVLRDAGLYRMWYTFEDGQHDYTGHAVSDDGMNWTPYDGDGDGVADAVVDIGRPGEIDEFKTIYPWVLRIGDEYRMWYSSQDNARVHRIAHAASTDGIRWRKYDGDGDGLTDPVLDANPEGPDHAGVCSACIVYDGHGFRMWYACVAWEDGHPNGQRCRIFAAASEDGIHWEKHDADGDGQADPVLDTSAEPGAPDSFSAQDPTVLWDAGMYHMWYAGLGPAHRWDFKICYAVSPDGLTWEKRGVALPQGAEGEWDSVLVNRCCVLVEESQYRMYYTGMGPDPRDIEGASIWGHVGVATAPRP